MSIRLHLPAVPFTITHDMYSHCAYTGKVKRFSPMMISRGFEVYHYGIETSDSGATKDIELMTKAEWSEYRIKSYQYIYPNLSLEEATKKHNDINELVGPLWNLGTPLIKEFNNRLRIKLKENYRDNRTDIVCLPLSRCHDSALEGFNYTEIETGIGYYPSYKDFRIFESYSFMSETLGKDNKEPHNYWFVIPNYFNTNEFKLNLNPTPLKVGFLGRLGSHKGCGIIVEIARKFPNLEFVLCGSGDPTPFLKSPNIGYKPPIHGYERSEYLGSCVAVLCLSKFSEPFCGVSVEAQLCGTPVISSDHGALVDNIEQFKTGLRGHTLADYCYGVQMALDGKFDRKYIRERAVNLYDMYKLAHNYEYVFKSVLDIQNGKGGWYSSDTHIAPLLDYIEI
jgi:glycosyltransferase involved in cell wall biosynthesis